MHAAVRTSRRPSRSRACGLGALAFTTDVQLDDYRSFYFLAALAQAVGNGAIAGLMESGRVVAGFRHAFAMLVLAYLALFVISS